MLTKPFTSFTSIRPIDTEWILHTTLGSCFKWSVTYLLRIFKWSFRKITPNYICWMPTMLWVLCKQTLYLPSFPTTDLSPSALLTLLLRCSCFQFSKTQTPFVTLADFWFTEICHPLPPHAGVIHVSHHAWPQMFFFSFFISWPCVEHLLWTVCYPFSVIPPQPSWITVSSHSLHGGAFPSQIIGKIVCCQWKIFGQR